LTATTIRSAGLGLGILALAALAFIALTAPFSGRAGAVGPGEMFIDADAPSCTDDPEDGAGETTTPFCSVTAAIAFLESASGSGGKLTLRAATYNEGTITTNHSDFSIRGDPNVARDAIVIRPGGSDDIGLHITDPLGSCDDFSIEHVTFDGTGHFENGPGILVDDRCEPISIRDVEVHGWEEQGILFADSSGDEGATVPDGTQIIDADVHDNGKEGILLNDGAGNVVEGGSIIDNESTGLRADRQFGLDVEDVEITGNGLHGIHDFEGLGTEIMDNTISGNAENGILLTGPYTNVAIEGNTLSNNGAMGVQSVAGLFGTGGSDTALRDNEIMNNTEHGVGVAEHARLTVESQNEIRENGGIGILLDDGTDAVVRDNVISANDGAGVLADDQERLALTGNEINENGGNGVDVARGSSSRVENNEINDSGADGVNAADAVGLRVLNNDLLDSTTHGIEVFDGSDNVLDENTILRSGTHGITSLRELALSIAGNDISDSGGTGMRLTEGTNGRVVANTIMDNGTEGGVEDYGLSINAETNLLVEKNVLERNFNAQIFFNSSDDVRIIKNDFVTGVDGIILADTLAHPFTGLIIGGSSANRNRFRGLDPVTNECEQEADSCYVEIPQQILGVPVINATFNDWGTTIPAEIENLICHDNQGDCALTVVDFSNPRPPGDSPVDDKEPTPPPPGQCPVGDASDDDTVNSIDAALVLQFSAGRVGVLPCLFGADVNQDGIINAIDAALILQFSAGLIDELPV